MKKKRGKYMQMSMFWPIGITLLVLAGLMVWENADAPMPWLVLPLSTAAYLLSFIVPALVAQLRRRRKNVCELCNRKRRSSNDDMAWAKRFALDACSDCAFKVRVSFGHFEPPESRVDGTLH